MTWKELLTWILLIGSLILILWLMVAGCRRLWARPVPRASRKHRLPAPSHTPPLRVRPGPAFPLWVVKGWQRDGTGYTGYYRAGGRRWRGRIRVPYPGYYVAYIWNPPLRELARHSYFLHFQRRGGDGRYLVHFCRRPLSLDHVILSIEMVLEEALSVQS